MRLMRRFAGLLVLLALTATLISSVDPVLGQVPGSPADSGMQILQGLSSQQRDSLSQQLGGLGGSLGAQGNLGARQAVDEEQQNLNKEQQRQLLMDMQKQRAELERL